MAVNGWFFGMQTTLLPMIVSISTNIINIGLSLLLVFGLDIGFNGVAWGTFGANWIGLAIALALAIRFKGIRSLVTTPENIFRFSTLKRFFKVNGDIFLRSACIMAVSIAVTVFGSRINNLTLATNAVMMQFFIMFSYFMDGLAFTAEALTGRFAGNGDRTMLYRTIRHILAWGAGVMIVFFITYLLFSDVFVSMITDDSLVIQNIRHYSFFLVLIPPVTVAAFIFDGIYIGLTATGKMLGATFIASLAFFAVCTLHFNTPYFGFPDNYTIWTAFLIYLFLRGCILSLMTGKTINNFFHR